MLSICQGCTPYSSCTISIGWSKNVIELNLRSSGQSNESAFGGSLHRAMRYKTLEEVAGKYGLTVDLDEKAQFAEWENRLKKLLESKQKELPNARNPSLRHKVERECAEVQEAFKFVSQQNFFTKLRRCVDEDKQEIFEHDLRKPESRPMLPSENDPEFEQFLELKVAARKKWPGNPVPVLANPASSSPLTVPPSNGQREQTAAAPAATLVLTTAAPIPQPGLSATDPARSATAAEPSKPDTI